MAISSRPVTLTERLLVDIAADVKRVADALERLSVPPSAPMPDEEELRGRLETIRGIWPAKATEILETLKG